MGYCSGSNELFTTQKFTVSLYFPSFFSANTALAPHGLVDGSISPAAYLLSLTLRQCLFSCAGLRPGGIKLGLVPGFNLALKWYSSGTFNPHVGPPSVSVKHSLNSFSTAFIFSLSSLVKFGLMSKSYSNVGLLLFTSEATFIS